MADPRGEPATSKRAARAKANFGCAEIKSGLGMVAATANFPAITAEAADATAAPRFLSCSTKTRSPGFAEPILEIPVISIAASPTSRAFTASATSFTVRFMTFDYTFSRIATNSRLKWQDGAEDFLDSLHRAWPDRGFRASALVGAGSHNSNLLLELVDRLP